jgi:hypothetical protein
MNDLLQTADELRKMSETELLGVFEDSLTNRLREQAAEALEKHGGLRPGNLETFLNDPDCVRYPTRLVLEYGEMGLHQFAQPEPDVRNPGGIMLYLRPTLGQRTDLIALAVSYMIPVINYGAIITDDHCIEYGSVLAGLDRETYYQRICELAGFVGARELDSTDPDAHKPEEAGDAEAGSCETGGCGSGGCGCH